MDQTTRPAATSIRIAAWAGVIALLVGSAAVSAAGDWVDEGGIDAGLKAPRRVAPWMQPSMSPKLKAKLTVAFELAVDRVEGSAECAALFDEIGADGIEMLAKTLYFPAPVAKKTTTCRRSNAFTFVGEAPTFLCGSFRSLSDEQAALVIVHEALHHAGLEEGPSVPGAMSSNAINEMVRSACGFEVFRNHS